MISVISCSVRSKGLGLVKKALSRQTYKDFEHIIQRRESDLGDKYWTLYSDYNKAVKKAKGDLIVSWQDYTYAKPDTLEKFAVHYEQEPKTIVGAVGNKYADDTWAVMTWKDPRERDDQGSYYNVNHVDIEWNLCSIPREAIYEVGGFDESLDYYSSLCGLDVLQRLWLIGGYEYKLDQTIKSYSLEHGRLPKWQENTPFKGAWENKCKEYILKPTLHYL